MKNEPAEDWSFDFDFLGVEKFDAILPPLDNEASNTTKGRPKNGKHS